MLKKLTVLGIALVMLFSVAGLTGCGDEQERNGTAADRTAIAFAMQQFQSKQSYTETLKNLTTIDEVTTADHTIVTKYEKKGSETIAESYTISDGEIIGYGYISGGYKYSDILAPVEMRYKIYLGENIQDIASTLTAEMIEQIDGENFKVKTDNGNTVYSFKFQVFPNMTADYEITIQTESKLVLEIKVNGIAEIDGKTVISKVSYLYDYTPITVNLPDDLDTYPDF